MAEGGIRARLEQLAARARDSLRLIEPGPEPGSAQWQRDLEADVDQAKRNEADREDVVTRRRATIRRASDDARPAELLALAEIESVSGLPGHARERVLDVLSQGPLPEATFGFATSLVSRLASEVDAQEQPEQAVALFDAALVAAEDAPQVSIALLCGKASLHVRQLAPRAAEAAAVEGLRQLGWGLGPDPYRGIAEQRLELDTFEVAALVSLVCSLATAMSYLSAFDDASRQLVDLRTFLQTSAEGRLHEHALSSTEAWLDYRRGDLLGAERKLGAAYDHAVAMDEHESTGGVATLINLGWIYVELELIEQASGVAKVAMEIVERRELQDRDSLVRTLGLGAEVALRKGELDAAEELAKQGLERAGNRSELRAGSLRVLAGCAHARGDEADALRLAKESVDLATSVIGDDVSVVDELLVLARVAAPSDRKLAEATLQRAASIPMPSDHPHREKIERARVDLCTGRPDR